jgi:hypothetical protein
MAQTKEEKLRKKRECAMRWRLANPELKKQRDRAGYLKFRKERLAKDKERYAHNPEMRKTRIDRVTEWRTQNKNRFLAYIKKRRMERKAENPELFKTKSRQSYIRNLEKHKARRLSNRERHKAYVREWDRKNPEKRQAMNEAWRAKNPDKVRALRLKRRLKARVGAEPNIRIKQVFPKGKTFVCYYCKKRKSVKRLNIDHITPIAMDGRTRTDNLCQACETCNKTKHAKSLVQWIPPNGQAVLPL